MSIQAMKQALEFIEVGSAKYAAAELRAAIEAAEKRCEAGVTLSELWDCWEAAKETEKQEPVAEVTQEDINQIVWLVPSLGVGRGSKLYATPQPAIPAGMVLVPVEPTPEMVSAMYQCITYNIEQNSNDLYDSYKAMLAAAQKLENSHD